MRPVPMISGRCWEFEHNNIRYQILSLNGSEKVALYWSHEGSWVFRLARYTRGRSAKVVAEEIYKTVLDIPSSGGTPLKRVRGETRCDDGYDSDQVALFGPDSNGRYWVMWSYEYGEPELSHYDTRELAERQLDEMLRYWADTALGGE